jgi:cytochrome c553
MQSMVGPRADSLWNAVGTSVTEKGVEIKAPTNDEEWASLRHEAVTLAEAMNSILISGRKVANPGDQPKDPQAELAPEQIEILINEDRATWAKLAHDLQNAVTVAIKAVDAKDAEALSNAGGGIDTACETCHKKYWYPNQEARTKQ